MQDNVYSYILQPNKLSCLWDLKQECFHGKISDGHS